MTYSVEVLTEADLIWYVEVAAVNMLQEEVGRPELVNMKNLYGLALMGIEGKTAFICKKDGVPIGALGSLLVPNTYNPELQTLAELFWYVLPEHRNGRAGALLFKSFDDCAKEKAYDATFSLLNTSRVNTDTLIKRGYKLSELGFRKQMEETWPL